MTASTVPVTLCDFRIRDRICSHVLHLCANRHGRAQLALNRRQFRNKGPERKRSLLPPTAPCQWSQTQGKIVCKPISFSGEEQEEESTGDTQGGVNGMAASLACSLVFCAFFLEHAPHGKGCGRQTALLLPCCVCLVKLFSRVATRVELPGSPSSKKIVVFGRCVPASGEMPVKKLNSHWDRVPGYRHPCSSRHLWTRLSTLCAQSVYSPVAIVVTFVPSCLRRVSKMSTVAMMGLLDVAILVTAVAFRVSCLRRMSKTQR